MDNLKDEIYQMIENVSESLGRKLTEGKEIVIEDRGYPHKPPSMLPENCATVYSFIYNGEFLKTGKANKKSNARYTSHHYGFNAPSTLAKSICKDARMQPFGINAGNVREWIMQNTQRIDILIKCENSEWATNLIEAIMHYKYKPRYEGKNILQD